jgi:hypothetical protein
MAHKDLVVYHVNRDSTAIPARGKVVKKREEKGVKQGAKISLERIDKECTWGCKKNSEGNGSFWKGYKLHRRSPPIYLRRKI